MGIDGADATKGIAFHLRATFLDPATDELIKHLTGSVGLSSLLHTCVEQVLLLLRTSEFPCTVRSITLFLEHFEGVAFTKGSDLDDDHKEIHLSIHYFAKQQKERQAAELKGVLVHELVHCFQFTAKGSLPGGLIEGMADYVRLLAGLSPPHWDPDRIGTRWDEGYEKTAYFLRWIDLNHDESFTTKLHLACHDRLWTNQLFFQLTNVTLQELWRQYTDARQRRLMTQKSPHRTSLDWPTSTTRSSSTPVETESVSLGRSHLN